MQQALRTSIVETINTKYAEVRTDAEGAYYAQATSAVAASGLYVTASAGNNVVVNVTSGQASTTLTVTVCVPGYYST
jgi:hypothetical protein